jgi:hypothetical protein
MASPFKELQLAVYVSFAAGVCALLLFRNSDPLTRDSSQPPDLGVAWLPRPASCGSATRATLAN